MESATPLAMQQRPATWKTLGAFATIYIVWGCTFLAIRVGVHEMPPLLFASMRFLTAGLALVLYMVARGERPPNGRQWLSATLLALLIFVGDYGLLFWAERRVPSGVAAVMMAITPAFTAIAEIVLLRTQRLTLRLGVALLLGTAGVCVLMSHSVGVSALGAASIDRVGAAVLIFASLLWAIGSVITRLLPLPQSKAMSSGTQMLVGGLILAAISAGVGDLHNFHASAISTRAWLALLYLIVAGSIIGFTVYIWLLHHQSPTMVGTYAYVNPVVAVIVGYFVGGEALGTRTVLGAICVLISVIVLTTTPKTPVVRRAQGTPV